MSPATRPSAFDLINVTVDEDSFESWDDHPTDPELGDDYATHLDEARRDTGVDEAVITGRGTVGGHPVGVIAGHFEFLAGSIGVAAADRIVAAFERATAEGLPVLAAPASGGTRMQEGSVAFSRMINIVQAVNTHKLAGLPYLVYLRHPTTGGVFATWGSLGHITVAEPGALIGFLGPKVFQALHGEPFPRDVQTAENLFAHGLLDAVLDAKHLRHMVTRVLDILSHRQGAPADGSLEGEETSPAPEHDDAWESVTLSRDSSRPGLRTLLRFAATDVIGLHGTGMGEKENASMVALARFGHHAVVVVGLDRHAQSFDGPLGPGALRQARRGMGLASELNLPLVTVIDTPGAALSREAEEGGLGGEIARCLSELIELPVPTVSVVLGQGTGGAAIALFPADRIIATRHGWLSPLPPEGASVIRYGHTDFAADMARGQGIVSTQLLQSGLVDHIVDESEETRANPRLLCERVGEAIQREVQRALSLHHSHPTRGARVSRRARMASHLPHPPLLTRQGEAQ